MDAGDLEMALESAVSKAKETHTETPTQDNSGLLFTY